MRIDIWSDIACPWCWVGKRRLEEALARFEEEGVEVCFRSYELNRDAPKAPASDIDYAERLARKYGTDRAGGQAMIDRMTDTAAEDGLTMRFDHIKPTNTFDAHRLIHLAHARGKQDAMKERLFKAYLEDGLAIGDRKTLSELGQQVGLDGAEVDDVLEGDRYGEEVRADEKQAMRLGINGVPFFVVNGELGFSGAQPVDVIVAVLNQSKR